MLKKILIFSVLLSILGSAAVFFLGSYQDRESQTLSLPEWVEAKSDRLDELEKNFDKTYEMFQEQIEEALVWRASAIQEIGILRAKTKSGVALSAEDLIYIHEGIDIYLNFRYRLLELADKGIFYLDPRVRFEWAPGSGSDISVISSKDNEIEKLRLRIDPLDDRGNLGIKEFKVALASALVLYDNFMVAIWPYYESDKLRALIDFDHHEHRQALQVVMRSYLDPQKRMQLQEAIRYFQFDKKWRVEKANESEIHSYLDTLILTSPSYEISQSEAWLETRWDQWIHFIRSFFDSFGVLRGESLAIVSQLFGNSVGLVETREGKIKQRGEEVFKAIEKQLQPLDILLEKTPFRLTDKLIPGYYGHVAVWMGSANQLKTAGLWDLKELKPYHSALLQGKSVVEALRPGVTMNYLDKFLNVDDLAVLRIKDLDLDRKKRFLGLLAQQVGKRYDFNFDVETANRIVCSELVYMSFPGFDWPISKQLGRYTISPDQVAKIALKFPEQFEISLLYQNGKKIDGDLRNHLRKLVAE